MQGPALMEVADKAEEAPPYAVRQLLILAGVEEDAMVSGTNMSIVREHNSQSGLGLLTLYGGRQEIRL